MLPAYKLPCTAILLGKDDQDCCNLLGTLSASYMLINTFRQVFRDLSIADRQ